ncbi:DNA topology modulation protein [Clostridium sp.]|uniref:DNA topology modulation protein n=1 Tax=Clostridium sp. TaxID=1506 RepID=UPI0032165115
MDMNKIAVIGSGGAGKSTFSRKLGELISIPVYHLDSLYWSPGWIETPKDKWEPIVEGLAKKEEWVIDGNYGNTLDIRLKAADTIIFLKMPTYLCLYRIIKRRFMYQGKTRPDMNAGCEEKLDLEFVNWVWSFNRKRAPGILEKIERYEGEKKVIILKSPSEVEAFLKSIKDLVVKV